MPSFQFSLQTKQNHSIHANWNKEKEKNYFLQVEKTKLKLKKNFVNCSPYIHKLLHQYELENKQYSQESCILKLKNIQKIQFPIIEFISKILDGQSVIMRRNQEIVKVIRVSLVFQLKQLVNQILQDVKNNLEHYGFFILFYISRQFHIEWLKQKCEKQLIQDNYQEINYNRYDLILLPEEYFREVFILVFILHSRCVKQGKCKGQPSYVIKEIFKQYSEAKNINITPSLQKLSQLNSIPEVEQVDSPKFPNQPIYRLETLINQQTQTSTRYSYYVDFTRKLKQNDDDILSIYQKPNQEKKVLKQKFITNIATKYVD